MHIEKNVCESIIGTLLDIPGKTKDGLTSRLDLVEMGIRTDLAPEQAAAGEDHTDIRVIVTPSTNEKCERCWIHRDTVGADQEHPTLCARCASVVK